MLSARLLASVSLLGLAWSSDVPSRPDQRPLLTTAVRERLLREASKAIKKDKPGMCGWYSRGGERLLSQLLDHMPSSDVAERGGQGKPSIRDEKKWTTAHGDALWLLCRTQLGAIEAALIELGGASSRCARLRKRWRQLERNSASERLGAFVAGRFGGLVGDALRFLFVGRTVASAKFGCAHTLLGKGV